MRRPTHPFLIVLLFAPSASSSSKNLYDLIQSDSNLITFGYLINQSSTIANLRQKLEGYDESKKNYTIFAPTDAAIKRIQANEDAINYQRSKCPGRLAWHHIHIGDITSMNLLSLRYVTTGLRGIETLNVTTFNNTVKIDDAKIIGEPHETTNGHLFKIDRVLVCAISFFFFFLLVHDIISLHRHE